MIPVTRDFYIIDNFLSFLNFVMRWLSISWQQSLNAIRFGFSWEEDVEFCFRSCVGNQSKLLEDRELTLVKLLGDLDLLFVVPFQEYFWILTFSNSSSVDDLYYRNCNIDKVFLNSSTICLNFPILCPKMDLHWTLFFYVSYF